MLAREIEQDADDLVFHPAQTLGAAAAVAVFQQQLLGLAAALVERRFQPLRDVRAQFTLAADMGLGEFFKIRNDGAGIDQVAGVPGGRRGRRVRAGFEGEGGHDAIRIAEAGAEVTGSAKIFRGGLKLPGNSVTGTKMTGGAACGSLPGKLF